MSEAPTLHPVSHARTDPDRPAYIMAATGESVSYAKLDARANRGARLIRSLGLKRGDGMAVMMDNSPRYLEIMWAAERTGVYCTCISSKLNPAEAEYIIRDGNCRLLIASKGVAGVASELLERIGDIDRLMCDGTIGGYESYEDARYAQYSYPLDDPQSGGIML